MIKRDITIRKSHKNNKKTQQSVMITEMEGEMCFFPGSYCGRFGWWMNSHGAWRGRTWDRKKIARVNVELSRLHGCFFFISAMTHDVINCEQIFIEHSSNHELFTPSNVAKNCRVVMQMFYRNAWQSNARIERTNSTNWSGIHMHFTDPFFTVNFSARKLKIQDGWTSAQREKIYNTNHATQRKLN